ncbi:MAG: hypothetical protein FJ028_01355, partial [Chloroflexi bacterium]|nr:hypothetical protein [Chloroflexota bacterium]
MRDPRLARRAVRDGRARAVARAPHPADVVRRPRRRLGGRERRPPHRRPPHAPAVAPARRLRPVRTLRRGGRPRHGGGHGRSAEARGPRLRRARDAFGQARAGVRPARAPRYVRDHRRARRRRREGGIRPGHAPAPAVHPRRAADVRGLVRSVPPRARPPRPRDAAAHAEGDRGGRGDRRSRPAGAGRRREARGARALARRRDHDERLRAEPRRRAAGRHRAEHERPREGGPPRRAPRRGDRRPHHPAGQGVRPGRRVPRGRDDGRRRWRRPPHRHGPVGDGDARPPDGWRPHDLRAAEERGRLGAARSGDLALTPRACAAILAAGSSQRLGEDKVIADLGGVPVVCWSIAAAEASGAFDEVVVVAAPARLAAVTAAALRRFGAVRVVAG